MSKRIDKSWLVFVSVENFEHNRCVALFSRPDGTYGFEEFEDGAWPTMGKDQRYWFRPASLDVVEVNVEVADPR